MADRLPDSKTACAMHVVVRRPDLGHRFTTVKGRSGATNVEKTAPRQYGFVNAIVDGVLAGVDLDGPGGLMTNPDLRMWTPHRA